MSYRKQLVFAIFGWCLVAAGIAWISASDIKHLNHWFWSNLPSFVVIMGYGIFCMVLLPIFCVGLLRSSWQVVYQPYYNRWGKKHQKGIDLQEDDFRLAGNPEFPKNQHDPIQSIREASGSGDAFQKP